MARPDSKFTKWGKAFILVLSIPLSWLFLWELSTDLAHREDAEARAAEYAAGSQERITQVCLRRESSDAVAECETETTVTAREQQRREQEVQAQQSSAHWTRVMAWLGLVGLPLSLFGILAVWRSIKQGQKTYEAFVAVEDASLVVEFHRGHRIESISDGIRQPDTYFIPWSITNIGRSAARIRGWSIAGTDSRWICESTLNAGATFGEDDLEHIMLEEPTGNFKVLFPYSSPVRERMVLEVSAVLLLTQSAFGGEHHINARITGTRLRRGEE